MATYLQGVQDYIPQFQPFDPNLNFYSNVLQTKQTQYDSNWKALNNIYGQYFYADLTRDPNIAKKEELVKQIDFNLRRISGLDLSLQQNVEQAMQVFKPFYEDKFLMKDMAYTKNYMNKRSGALNLKASQDEKDREMYWDTGVRAMDYMREEFKNSSDEESLNFSNVQYTPYKNVAKMYLDLAKSSGIKMETPSWSDDGRYKIITRNGEQIIEPLTYLFKSAAANDPQLQDIYRTQSYVNRKDYVMQNAQRFGGDQVAAERAYLSEQYNTIQTYINKNKAESAQEKLVNDTNKAETIKTIQSGNATMFTQEYLNRLNAASQSIDNTDEYNTKLQNTISDGSSTLTTSSYTPNQDMDLDLLRLKVDSGVASMLMNQDIAEAAFNNSYIDYKVTTEADPYALENYKQANREKLLTAKKKNDEKNLVLEHGLKTGYYVLDTETGGYKTNPKYDNTLIKSDASASGGTTEAFSAQEYNEELIAEAGEDYGASWVKSISGILNTYRNNNNVSDGQLAGILGEGIFTYGNLSTDDDLSAHISLANKNKPFWERGFLNNASKAMANPSYTLEQMAKNPGTVMQKSSYSQLKNMKDGVDRFMYETLLREGDAGKQGIAGRYLGFSDGGINTPEAQVSINFERYLLNKQAFEQVSEDNEKIFYDSTKGTAVDQFTELYWNGGMPLDKETFMKRAAESLPIDNVRFGLEDIQPQGGTPLPGTNFLMNQFNNLSIAEIQKRIPLNPEQRKSLDQFKKQYPVFAQAEKIGASATDDSVRGKLLRSWYEETFGLTDEGRQPTYTQQRQDLEKVWQDLNTRLVGLTASNKLKSISSALNDLKLEGGKFALTATQNTGRYINLNTAGTPGYNTFVQFALSDMNKMSKTNYEFSFDGNNKSAFDEKDLETQDTRRNLGMQVIGIYQNLLNTGQKFEDPEIYQAQIAKEDRTKGAMIFYPKMDVLAGYIGTDKKPGMLTQEQANRMVQNGIAIAAPRSTWRNDLFMNNKIGGIQSLLNTTENGKVAVSYSNPISGGFEFIKDNTSSVGYRIVNITKFVDDYTGRLEEQRTIVPEANYGKDIDMTYLIMRNQIAALGSRNLADYKTVIRRLEFEKTGR
jgi:hypothetical protein